VITITGFGDHNQPEWLIIFTGIRTILIPTNECPMPLGLKADPLRFELGVRQSLALGVAIHSESP
jgi:hypothetical protein